METNDTTREHYEKYKAMVEKAGVDLSDSSQFNKEDMAEAYAKDKHLNTIPLVVFDTYYHHMQRHFPAGFSLAENCCLYKHAIVYGVLGLEPAFVD